jgi:ABC-type dipeptide/oligopeptide/nickel transport system permease subunit
MSVSTEKPIVVGLGSGASVAAAKQSSLTLDAWRRFKRNKAAVAGLVFIVALTLVAIFAPFIAPYHYAELDIRAVTQKPGGNYLLGTDQLGRDLLSRLIYGARVSLLVGVVVQSIIIIIGVPVGLVAGYFGGKIDTFLMRLVDVLYAKPNLLFIIIVMTFLKAKFQTNTTGVWGVLKSINDATGGLLGVFIGLGLVSWLTVSRLVRGQVLSLKKKEFVEAARCIGATDRQIISRHLLPNTLAVIIVAATLGIPGAILSEAGISFIGLGINPPTPSWGSMISDGVEQIRNYPHILIAPAVALSLTVLSFNFVGDGLRDALDPWMKK